MGRGRRRGNARRRAAAAGDVGAFSTRLRTTRLKRRITVAMCITMYNVRWRGVREREGPRPCTAGHVRVWLPPQEEAEELQLSLDAVYKNLASLQEGGVPPQQVRLRRAAR